MKLTIGQIIFSIYIFSFFSFGQQTQSTYNRLGNLDIKNYSNKFLERPESVWSVLRESKSKKVFYGTYEGILEYDGINVNRIEIEGEIENEIRTSFTRTLLEDNNKNIYTAGAGFFGKIIDSEYGGSKYASLMEKLPDTINPYIQVFWGGVSKEEDVYLYTRDLIFKYNGQDFEKIWKLSEREEGVDSYGSIQTILKVDERIFARVWGIGLFELIDGNFKFIENSTIFSSNRIESMASLDKNKIAIFSSKLGIVIFDESNQFKLHTNKELNNWLKEKLIYNTSEVKKLSDGKIPLISFEGGIIIIDSKLNIVDLIDQRDGLLSNTITSIYIDQNDDIFSTSLLSASKIKLSNSITSFTESNGIKGLVQKIKKVDNKIYFSTTEDIFRVDQSISSLKNNEIIDLQINDIPKDFISFGNNILSVNNLNSLIIGDNSKRLVSNDRLLESPIKSELNENILIMAHPIEGIVFFKLLNDKRIIKIKSNKIFNEKGVLGVKEIAKGVLFVETINNEGSFICYYNKTGRITSKRLLTPDNNQIFTATDFPSDQKFNSQIDQEYFSPLELNLIKTGSGFFIFDQNLDLYSFTDEFNLDPTGENLLQIFEKNLINFDPITRLANISGRQQFTSVNPITKNNWFLSSQGLIEVNFKQGGNFDIVGEYSYGVIDINELSGAIFADNIGSENLLWLGSKDSKLISYLPNKYLNDKKITVKPIINSAIFNGERTNLFINDFSYNDSRNIKIDFSFPSLEKVEENLYRFRLIGLNDNWSDWSASSESIFTNLYEGDYIFEVQALDANLNESETASYLISINPPWFRSYLAYFIYLLIIAGLIWFFGKFQAKRSLAKAENERREKDLEEAKQIQESMLPKAFPQIKGLTITAGLITSTEVGGDYYDFFESNDKSNSIHVICGDATGHGTAAGMMVSIIKSALNGLPTLPVNEILERLNNIVKKINLGRLRMSLNVARISNREIEISAAAMPPTYLFKAKSNKCEEIMIEGLPLGGLKDEKFSMIKKPFEKGDVLVMLSDGLPEASNENKEMYDYDRIIELITKNHSKEPEDIKTEFFKSLDSWLEGGIPDDDVTLVIVKKVA
ncbi:MAG: hypothetical protein CMC63_03190 [Flavobacteriaceae bacterium]|nr:hypothetical protein [Flavobacteriaceae bacterium]